MNGGRRIVIGIGALAALSGISGISGIWGFIDSAASPGDGGRATPGTDAVEVAHSVEVIPSEDLTIESWKYDVEGSIVDVVAVTPADGDAAALVSDRPLVPKAETIAVNGLPATLERTADEFGPGLLVVTWALDDRRMVQVVARDSMPLDDLLELAGAVGSGTFGVKL